VEGKGSDVVSDGRNGAAGDVGTAGGDGQRRRQAPVAEAAGCDVTGGGAQRQRRGGTAAAGRPTAAAHVSDGRRGPPGTAGSAAAESGWGLRQRETGEVAKEAAKQVVATGDGGAERRRATATDGKPQHGRRQLATVPAGNGSRPTAATSRRRRHD